MSNVLISFAIVSGSLAAVPAGSGWSDDYGYSLKVTRLARRPLLLVLDKPADENQRARPARFSPGPVQAALLSPYELCHVDVTSSYGQKVANAFGAKKFPYTAILDKTGKVIIYEKTGHFRPDEWISVLAAHRAGQRKTRTASARRRSADCFT